MIFTLIDEMKVQIDGLIDKTDKKNSRRRLQLIRVVTRFMCVNRNDKIVH